MSIIDYYTKTIKRRGSQIDKVYDYWQKASDAYVRGAVNLNSGPATKWLKKLRDYLNKEFPDAKRKKNRPDAGASGRGCEPLQERDET